MVQIEERYLRLVVMCNELKIRSCELLAVIGSSTSELVGKIELSSKACV